MNRLSLILVSIACSAQVHELCNIGTGFENKNVAIGIMSPTYFVDPSGSDSNNGLRPGSA